MCHYDCDVDSNWMSTSHPKARKPHRCYECGLTIPKGERHTRVAFGYPGERPEARRQHTVCADLAYHIQIEICGQDFIIIGSLLDDVTEHAQEHPEVMEKLKDIRKLYADAV